MVSKSSKTPQKRHITWGDGIDPEGLKLKAVYNYGLEEELKEGYTLSPETFDKSGKQKVTVTYGNQTAEFEVEVSDVIVTSVSVEKQPSKKSYYTGDALETAGFVLKAKYSNGTEEVTSGFTCSPSVLNTAGTQRVTVYLGDQSTSFDVIVEEAKLESISIRANPTKTTYTVGSNLDASGLSLTAVYSNKKTEIVTSGFTCSPTNFTTIGTQTVTVSYEGKATTFQVNVQSEVLQSISVKTNPTKTSYMDLIEPYSRNTANYHPHREEENPNDHP